MMPTFPPVFPLLFCLSFLALFGVGFNAFVGWVNKRRIWPVSFSVVIGVAVTLLVPTVVFGSKQLFVWQSALVYLIGFVASGVPMIAGNVLRETNGTHKVRRLGNHATKVRDEVVFDLNAMMDEIVNGGVAVEKVLWRLHQAIGSLKSL
jgi:hypothetical protein